MIAAYRDKKVVGVFVHFCVHASIWANVVNDF
jgi:hypothetical protein